MSERGKGEEKVCERQKVKVGDNRIGDVEVMSAIVGTKGGRVTEIWIV